jgi:hypothetical protein
MLRNIGIIIFLSFLTSLAYGQTAQIQGRVADPSGAVIPKARVRIVDQQKNTERTTTSNGTGEYVFSGLNPSSYRIFVSAAGFKTAESSPITLHVEQNATLDFQLKIGGSSETVTVDASGGSINTTDATVSTVVDRKFVDNMPLNGRSFQDLILLAPGVTTQSSQSNDVTGGEFSVNGQRADANYFTVDGVSASNRAGSVVSGPWSAGMLSSATVLGTTQSMLPADALQEFRISTSTYSAEFGRQPGGQISMQSRSGTNEYHGTAFDYLRNGALDSNDWFNDYATPVIPKPAERQNDFGGTLGGPIGVPGWFSGNNRAFLFFSYEGLRLTSPQPATVYYAPSNGTYNTSTKYASPLYKNLRANAPAALQPVLNSFPLPNCSVTTDPQCVDYGDGLSPYIQSIASPASIDSINARVDVQALSWLRIFARYGDTDSHSTTPVGPESYTTSGRTRVFILGADSVFHGSITNQFRYEYSPTNFLGKDISIGDQPANLWALQGIPVAGESAIELDYVSTGTLASLINATQGQVQFQTNPTDTVTWKWRSHLFKAGVDYRQTTAYFGYKWYSRDPYLIYIYETSAQVLQNATLLDEDIRILRQNPTTKNFGTFIQDDWRVKPRVSLSLGLRWDLNPPPSATGAPDYTYNGDLNNPSTMTLAPLGTPLYKTTYTDLAPRFGMAVVLHNRADHETVLRTGAGLFYDTGQQFSYTFGGGQDLGSGHTTLLGSLEGKPISFPMPQSVIFTPVPAPAPPYTIDFIPVRNIVPPSTVQWSATLEQAIGKGQSFTIGYVGSAGLNLINFTEYSIAKLNPQFSSFYAYVNGPGSNYNSLQTTYRRQIRNGLDVMASYTWAHSIDSSSTDYNLLPIQRGNSNHDVRNVFSSAMVYDLPTQYARHWQRSVLGGWGLDLRVTARSAFPVQIAGATVTDPVSGNLYASRLNYSGQNPYVYKSGIPGGRQFSPAVFTVPKAGQVGNAPRNALRGFGEADADVAIRRTFPVWDKLNLQFRVEAFNVTNHPNFGTLNVTCGTTTAGASCTNPLLGQATNTLGNALSGGGHLTSGTLGGMYQQGGPRSLQLSLKLQF